MHETSYEWRPIGRITTPFHEKFGVPRQSLMMSEAWGCIKLRPDPEFGLALRNLEQFSHIWILFLFHRNGDRGWRPLIDTPRLEATQRMGVFATRSPHRPNPIGMSVVKLESIDRQASGGIEIHVRGIDILDGSPLLDIKPYLPYADRVEEANSGWVQTSIQRYPVEFSNASLAFVEDVTREEHPNLKVLLQQMLEYDPRPTPQKRSAPLLAGSTEGMTFAFRILGFDVRWEVRQGKIWVSEIIRLSSSSTSASV